jgi:hypothetical protein
MIITVMMVQVSNFDFSWRVFKREILVVIQKVIMHTLTIELNLNHYILPFTSLLCKGQKGRLLPKQGASLQSLWVIVSCCILFNHSYITECMNKNIRDLYRGINEFKKGYQPRTN